MLFRVVEKSFCPGRRNFVLTGGLWHGDISGARRAAELIAPTSLAHRLFIVSSTGLKGSRLDVVEEVPLAGLAERLTQMDLQHLSNHHPDRVAAERMRLERRATWLSSIAMLV